MNKEVKRSRSVLALTNEVLDFDKHWKMSIVNGRTIYTATSDRSIITVKFINSKFNLVTKAIEIIKRGRHVIIIGSTVYLPPRKWRKFN